MIDAKQRLGPMINEGQMPHPSQNKLQIFSVLILGLVALCRGLRTPNQFSSTLVLVDYQQGFTKRGFVGAFLGRPLHLETYSHFCIFSYGLIVLLATLVGVFITQTRAMQRPNCGDLIQIFTASYAVTYIGHLVGYLDIFLAVIATALLLVRRPHLRFLIGLPLTIAAILSHEMFVLVFLPVILLSFVVDYYMLGNHKARLSPIYFGLLLTISSGLVALRLALHASLTLAQVTAMSTDLMIRADHPINPAFLSLFQLSARDNVKIMQQLFLHDHRFLLLWTASIATFSMTIVPLLSTALILIRARHDRRGSAVLAFGAICASLAPWMMNFVGFDYVRWNAWAALASFLVLLLIIRGDVSIRLPKMQKSAIVLLVGLNMSCGDGLMDHASPHSFPFVESTMHLIHQLKTQAHPSENAGTSAHQ